MLGQGADRSSGVARTPKTAEPIRRQSVHRNQHQIWTGGALGFASNEPRRNGEHRQGQENAARTVPFDENSF